MNSEKIDWESVGWKGMMLKEGAGGLKSQTCMEKLIKEMFFSVYQNRRTRVTKGRYPISP